VIEAMSPQKIILDCDPGHDDAIAMLLAQGNPDIELVAVTTVAGNQTLQKVTRNALGVAAVGGIKGIPFAAGSPRPIVREPVVAGDIHGTSGLDGVEIPEPPFPLDKRHAVNLIIDTVMAAPPGEITLVATGALTNVALAVRMEPRIVERVRRVSLMGGGVHIGNCTPVAEFNIGVDPEAAHIVFNAPWDLTMIGLDVTHQALATPAVVEQIHAVGTPTAAFVGQLLKFFGETYKKEQGFDAPPVHDPCAIAYLIDPTIVRAEKAPLDVELAGNLTTAMTVADLRAPAPADCHTSVGTGIDADRFWQLVIDALKNIGQVKF
jgi:purine nucleosidase